eukprot:TRINITY_DN38270_c0_g1_i1.p4 TRINITY_DN38270_c0_g1~~TRINITY_DN38270_c0_g1_i1.p4  ORF type:complete len:157 (-),score=9.64 TRINITY_DN38270_c0_g1_i1:92-562(-)
MVLLARFLCVLFFFFKQKTAYEISACLVGSEMCIRDRSKSVLSKFIRSVLRSSLIGQAKRMPSLPSTAYSLAFSSVVKTQLMFWVSPAPSMNLLVMRIVCCFAVNAVGKAGVIGNVSGRLSYPQMRATSSRISAQMEISHLLGGTETVKVLSLIHI